MNMCLEVFFFFPLKIQQTEVVDSMGLAEGIFHVLRAKPRVDQNKASNYL